jgi:hypothetical protein
MRKLWEYERVQLEEAMDTGFYILEDYIYGPVESGHYYIHKGYVYGPEASGQYYLVDKYFYGPESNGQFYLDHGHIYGPSRALPWMPDEKA